MTQKEFDETAKRFEDNCSSILSSRTTQYQTATDPLYNFEVGADITGMTAMQTCWAYMSKHLAAVRKKVVTNDVSDMDDWLEKCTDIANYAKLLYITAVDTYNKIEQYDHDNKGA